MVKIFYVTGMTCDGCARAVSNAITAQAPAVRARFAKVESPVLPLALRQA